ncbi:thioesterase [Neoactinobaculum massilliense]|uniref:aldose epimerase family protein n=1 Tax=Neoactinobaculum massilliense TaxID=2364794 RepID=UPI000F51E5BB|nr:thioesterase [Neoactinobaculum massilliense]
MVDFSALDGVQLVTKHGLQAVEVKTDVATGLVYLYGAHVAAWAPAGQPSALYMSPDSVFTQGEPIRGGIPVITPWFGPSEDGLHGWARIHTWELEDVRNDAGTVTVVLTLAGERPGERDSAALSLRYTVVFGRELGIEFAVTNAGGGEVQPELALHAYWAVDARHVSLSGVESGGVDRLNGNAALPDGAFEALTGQTVDRFYPFTGPIAIADGTAGRTITVTSPESDKTVVWNPGTAGSQSNTDMPDDAWEHFVCVKATRVRDGAPRLHAGESAILTLHAALS